MHFNYDSDRLELLQNAHKPFRATGRFGLDALLEKDNLAKIDAHEIYIAQADVAFWKAHFKKEGAVETDTAPNLRVYIVSQLPKASHPILGAIQGQVADLDVLADDVRLMCPRYVQAKMSELSTELKQRIIAAGPL